MIPEEYYVELGKMLYAMAMADGEIKPKEAEKFHELVKNELKPLESVSDDFGSDLAFYTEFEFDVLEDEMVSVDEAYHSFIDYVKDHPRTVTKGMKSQAYDLACRIADSFKGTNQVENHFLHRLKSDLAI